MYHSQGRMHILFGWEGGPEVQSGYHAVRLCTLVFIVQKNFPIDQTVTI